MSDSVNQSYPKKTPSEERYESIQAVSFYPFRHLTRGYADAMSTLAPRAAATIQARAESWHARWDDVVSPGRKYAGLGFEAAIRQFDTLEDFGAAICSDIRLYYTAEETESLQSIYDAGLRRHRALYVERYQQNEREFNALADKVNDLLLDVALGVLPKETALQQIQEIKASLAPKE